jgi:hypothetical protein
MRSGSGVSDRSAADCRVYSHNYTHGSCPRQYIVDPNPIVFSGYPTFDFPSLFILDLENPISYSFAREARPIRKRQNIGFIAFFAGMPDGLTIFCRSPAEWVGADTGGG